MEFLVNKYYNKLMQIHCTLFYQKKKEEKLILTCICFEVGKTVALNILLLFCCYISSYCSLVSKHIYTHTFQTTIKTPIYPKDTSKDVPMDVMRPLAIMSRHIWIWCMLMWWYKLIAAYLKFEYLLKTKCRLLDHFRCNV